MKTPQLIEMLTYMMSHAHHRLEFLTNEEIGEREKAAFEARKEQKESLKRGVKYVHQNL
jgi:hypothetical protein